MRIQAHSINAPQSAISRSHGFTLIELLVVIGIILILMGLFFAGTKIVTAQAKERDTKQALETCKTMFENYKSATHLTRPPPSGPGPVSPLMPATTNLSMFNVTPPVAAFWTAGMEVPPTGSLSSDPSAYSNPGNLPQAVANTAYVMYALEAIPENLKIINNLPPSKVINVSIEIGTAGTVVMVPLIRDGYGNPILFVPGGGLGSNNPALSGVVWFDGANSGIVTSNGNIATTSTLPAFTLYDPNNATQFPAGPNTAPFFVSAGPDGDVSNTHGDTSGTATSDKTDDNIYSFRN